MGGSGGPRHWGERPCLGWMPTTCDLHNAEMLSAYSFAELVMAAWGNSHKHNALKKYEQATDKREKGCVCYLCVSNGDLHHASFAVAHSLSCSQDLLCSQDLSGSEHSWDVSDAAVHIVSHHSGQQLGTRINSVCGPLIVCLTDVGLTASVMPAGPSCACARKR